LTYKKFSEQGGQRYMGYTAPTEAYTGVVVEVSIGKEGKAIKIGGENQLPLHSFDDGSSPNAPKCALEILDMEPPDWAAGLMEYCKDVAGDSVAWAKKCQELGADAVVLRLRSTDPAEKDTSPDAAAASAKAVMDAIDIPLIVCGTGDVEKDAQVLPKVAEACKGGNILMGPAQKENFEPIGNAAVANGHTVVSQTPLDINLLKELNIKLSKIIPVEKLVIDPMSSTLGYGMEYSFTIMERVKQVGVIHKDGMAMAPIIADLANETWKSKEAKESKEQGVLWECTTAMSLLLAGANLLVLRHPDSLKLMKGVVGG
jgi:acetyl-CoA decarbonylase/synthase complex subunit delta